MLNSFFEMRDDFFGMAVVVIQHKRNENKIIKNATTTKKAYTFFMTIGPIRKRRAKLYSFVVFFFFFCRISLLVVTFLWNTI